MSIEFEAEYNLGSPSDTEIALARVNYGGTRGPDYNRHHDSRHYPGGPSNIELRSRELDPNHCVACIQNIGNKYSSIVVLNLLFGSEALNNDEEYLELVKDAVAEEKDTVFRDSPEDTVPEIYTQRIKMWHQTVKFGAKDDERTHLPPGILDPKSAAYVENFLTGPWTTFMEVSGEGIEFLHTTRTPSFPSRVLSRCVHPLVRKSLSFFTLPRNGTRNKNLGYCFACFRSRALLDRFRFLLDGKRVSLSSPKRLLISFARLRTLNELKTYFRHEADQKSNQNVFWFNLSPKELKAFYEINRVSWDAAWGTNDNYVPQFQPQFQPRYKLEDHRRLNNYYAGPGLAYYGDTVMPPHTEYRHGRQGGQGHNIGTYAPNRSHQNYNGAGSMDYNNSRATDRYYHERSYKNNYERYPNTYSDERQSPHNEPRTGLKSLVSTLCNILVDHQHASTSGDKGESYSYSSPKDAVPELLSRVLDQLETRNEQRSLGRL